MARAAKKGPAKKRATTKKAPTKRVAKKPAKPAPKPGRLTVIIDPAVIDRARNAVYWTPGTTVAGLVEAAITAMVDRLEQDRGESFAKRKSDLKAGRRVGT
jgi:hypothetical protein